MRYRKAHFLICPYPPTILRRKPNHLPLKPLAAMRTLGYIKEKGEIGLKKSSGKAPCSSIILRRKQSFCPYRELFQNFPLPLLQNPSRNSSRQRESFAVAL